MLIDIYNVLSLYVLPIPNSAFPKISINLLHAISNETAVDRKWGFWLIDLGNFMKLGQFFLY